jgi:hypothetical protein
MCSASQLVANEHKGLFNCKTASTFKFIVEYSSEGTQPAPTLLFDKPCGHGLIVDSIAIPYSEGVQAPQNNFNLSKMSLHFREDCGIFCEGDGKK